MSELPPIPTAYPVQPIAYQGLSDPQVRDASQLNMLATFHYVLGILVMVLACLPIIHLVLGVLMISGRLPSGNGPPPPAALGWLFVGLGAFFILLGWAMGILIVWSGRCIRARRRWMFSVVVAAIMCLNMPLGTILGVFTLVVLMRESVKALYGLRA